MLSFHATEVEPRRLAMQGLAGGTGTTSTSMKPLAVQEKEGLGSSSTSLAHDEGDEPTEEERQTLRKIGDKLPWSAFLVAVIELCERFAYYGLSGPFQNYIQNSYPDTGGIPGAIGKGHKAATGLTDFFQFWCYVTPIGGAIIADQFLGKYNTILYFAWIYLLGILILFLSSLPVAIQHGAVSCLASMHLCQR